MCGRFTLKTPVSKWLTELFPELALWAGETEAMLRSQDPQLLEPRFNIAPSQSIPVVIQRADDPHPMVVPMRWGLVPAWSDSPSIGYKMINARSETLAEKPSFQPLLASHRCVIVSDGYYEWQATESKTKQPYWIHRPDDAPFAMAGLWTINQKIDPKQTWLTTTIITTAANTTLRSVHDRMPAILETHDRITGWLNPAAADASDLLPMLAPSSQSFLTCRKVSTRVNKASEQGESLISE